MTIDFTKPAGKGSQPRPFYDYEQYKSNWDLIFNKKNLQSSDDECKKTQPQEETPKEDNSTHENKSS